jgi:hypothetical protein
MFDHFRKFVLGIVLAAGLALIGPAVVRADDAPNMQDTTT